MATSSVEPSTQSVRSLVFSDGNSHKFWKIELNGSAHTVTFGRVGTSGQTQTKEFDSDDAARKAYDKLVSEKLKKGYLDDEAGGSTPASGTSTTATKAAKKAPAKAAKGDQSQPSTTETDGGHEDTVTAAVIVGPAANINLSTDRAIDLSPTDWYRASFRPRPRLERGAPQPFDRDACLARLAKLKTTTYGYDTRWGDLRLPVAMSPEEAHFWLVAMTTPRQRDATLQSVADKVAKEKITGKIDAATARDMMDRCNRGFPEEGMLPLANLLSAEQFFELLINPAAREASRQTIDMLQIVAGMNQYIIPYLSDPERESLRKRIRKNWDPTQVPAAYNNAFPPEYYLAASLGMHAEVYEVTSSWADDLLEKYPYAEHYQWPQLLVFGLGSATLVESEWRRLKLKCHSADDARGLLACTEYAALDCLAADILAQTNKDKCEELLKVLVLVRAPEAALPMLHCKLSAKTPALARDWLERNVAHAVNGLLETAAGRGKLAEAALEYLHDVKRKGHAEVIAAALAAAGNADVAERIRTEVLEREEKVYQPLDAATTPPWLAAALEQTGKVRAKSLPGWASPDALPPLLVGDRRLNDEQVKTLLQVLAATPVGTRAPLVAALREHVDKHVRDAFASKLFQHWQQDGYPSANKWAMGAIGHLGDDGCVLKLTPLVRLWPGESQHARAVFGLECLRAIGSSVALMQLSGIAQKLKFKGLKAKAEQFVEEIAKDKGLSRAELEDRVVPDCGLDENGRREFSFGPRSFSFVLGGDLKAMVRDGDGKLRSDLPKPSGKDDAAVADAAVAEWKLLKKQIKEVATIQAGRLESAMVTGRRWSPDDFQTLIAGHPLMTHLAQKLIWAAFDAAGNKLKTFRVTEERDLADVADNATDLAGSHAVGVVHPLELSADERAAWGQVLSDYEIVTPFAQLGREVYSLAAGEESQSELTRFKGLKLVAPTLVFTLEKLGWTRGMAMDAGCFDEHSKQFPAAGVTAVVGYEGTVGMGYIDPNELLTLQSVVFCSGMRPPSGYGWDQEKKLKLGKVPPIVISEVLADMQVLKGKAK